MNKNLKNNNYVADEKISIISIGDVAEFEKIDEDIYSLVFDFTFRQNSSKGNNVIHSKNLSGTFIHAELMLNTTDVVECGGIKVAVIVDDRIVEADLKEKHGYDICNKALALISQNHPELLKSNDKSQIKSNMKESKSTEIDSNSSGKLEPTTIANAMYEYAKSSSVIPEYDIEDVWNNLSEKEKINMVNILQNNIDNFVEFINYFGLKTIKRCSDETSDLVRNIVFETLSKKLISSASNSMQKEQKLLNQKRENELLNSLIVELDKLNIEYDVLKFNSNSENKVNNHVVSIRNNEGCRLPLWIRIHNSQYIVLDRCVLDSNNDVNMLPESQMLPCDDLDYIINFITATLVKMQDSKKDNDSNLDCDNEEITVEESNATTEISTDNAIDNSSTSTEAKSKVKSKKEFRREFILNHLDELSDEDLLNELRRRMNFK